MKKKQTKELKKEVSSQQDKNIDMDSYNALIKEISAKREKNIKKFNIIFTIFGLILIAYGISTLIIK